MPSITPLETIGQFFLLGLGAGDPVFNRRHPGDHAYRRCHLTEGDVGVRHHGPQLDPQEVQLMLQALETTRLLQLPPFRGRDKGRVEPVLSAILVSRLRAAAPLLGFLWGLVVCVSLLHALRVENRLPCPQRRRVTPDIHPPP